MNENIISCLKAFQYADYDDDLIGICKSIVDFLKEIRRQIPNEDFPDDEKPTNFYKLEPHHPRTDLRQNFRDLIRYTVHKQEDLDDTIKLLNIYIGLLAGIYVYHMPADKMIQEGKKIDKEFTRKEAMLMLLEDNMSPNWIKEPSGRDFSIFMK